MSESNEYDTEMMVPCEQGDYLDEPDISYPNAPTKLPDGSSIDLNRPSPFAEPAKRRRPLLSRRG